MPYFCVNFLEKLCEKTFKRDPFLCYCPALVTSIIVIDMRSSSDGGWNTTVVTMNNGLWEFWMLFKGKQLHSGDL